MTHDASDYLTGTGLVIAVALAMVTMTMPATATHNSVGGSIIVTEASEINEDTGAIEEDIKEGSHADRLANTYHGNLAPHLPVRHGPQDQSGDGYRGDCTPFSEFGNAKEYEHALPNWADEDLSGVDNFYAENGSVEEAAVQDPETGQWIHEDAIEAAPDDACYVGYIEFKVQYSFTPLIYTIYGGDMFYGLNPPPDSDCDRGEFLLEDAGVDEENDCRTSGFWPGFGHSHRQRTHEHWQTLTIDAENFERGISGDQGVSSQFQTEDDPNKYEGSNSIALDLPLTYMAFLFGYSHPANGNPAPIDATWDGFELPFHGVPETVCGTMEDPDTPTRTPPKEECRILSPKDLNLYDTHYEESGLPEEEKGRLCELRIGYQGFGAGSPHDDPCGPRGYEITNYDVLAEAGGFVQNEDGEPAVASTYYNTLPGWQGHWLMLPHADHGFFDAATSSDRASNYGDALVFNETGREGDYERRILTVNPRVPDMGTNLECAWPQIVTDGETVNDYPEYESWATERIQTIQDSDDYASVQDYFDQEFEVIDHFGIAHPDDPDGETSLGNVSAPGVYGTYQAGAIDLAYWGNAFDTTMYGGVYHGDGIPGYDGYGEEVYPTVDRLFDVANNVARDGTDELDVLRDEAEPIENSEDFDELVQEIADVLDRSTQGTEELVNELFAQLNDLEDQATPFSSRDPDPWRRTQDPSYESFNRTLEMGVGCNDAGKLALTEEGQTIEGALNFGINMQINGERVQDPTHTNDDGEPARESNSSYGAWEPAWYSFGGPNFAYLDTTGNERYNGCSWQDENTHPNNDYCVWNIPYDVWGGIGGAKEALEEEGFRVNESEYIGTEEPYGNGMFFSLELTGPMLVSPYPTTIPNLGNQVRSLQSHMSETFLLNVEDPSETTCLVASTSSFWNETRMLRHFDQASEQPLDSLDQAAEEFLCSDKADRVEAIGSGYFWQNNRNDRYLSSYVYWTPLVPTTHATQDVIDSDDVLCNTVVLSHDPGTEVGEGFITLGPDGQTTTYYNNCLSLEEEFYEDGNPTKAHPLDGKYHTLPNFADNKR